MNLGITYKPYYFPAPGILRCATLPPSNGCIVIGYHDDESYYEALEKGVDPQSIPPMGQVTPGDSRSLQGSAFHFVIPMAGWWWLRIDAERTDVNGNPQSTKWEYHPTGDSPVFGPGSNVVDEGFSEVNDGGQQLTVAGYVGGNQTMIFGASRQAKWRYFEIQSGSGVLFIRMGLKPTLSGVGGDTATAGMGFALLNGTGLGTAAVPFSQTPKSFSMYGPNLWRGEIWALSTSGAILLYVAEGG